MAEIAAAVDFWKVEQGGVGVPCLDLPPVRGGRRVHSDSRGSRGRVQFETICASCGSSLRGSRKP